MRRTVPAAVLLLAACGRPEPPPPNVVLIVVDTLRADRLPFHGCARNNAPFLDSLAAESLVFENAWSPAAWTVPATASLFTSLHPFQHGVVEGFEWAPGPDEHPEEEPVNRIPPGVESLPRLLRSLGYRTFAISANPMVDRELGFDDGFDRFVGYDGEDAGVVNAQLAEWRDELGSGGPWFLYLHYFDPHCAYHAREPWFDPGGLEPPDAGSSSAFARLRARNGDDFGPWFEHAKREMLGLEPEDAVPPEIDEHFVDWVLAAYDSEVRYLDEHVREVFSWLDLDDAVVFVTADHGEEFLDHDGWEHGQSLYTELVHVPLLVRLPGADARRGRIPANASTLDVLPTVRAILGLPPSSRDEGANLLALAADRSTLAVRTDDPETLAEHGQLALVRGRYGLILDREEERAELYDLERDPGELHDVSAEHPELVEAMRAEIERVLSSAPRHERCFGRFEAKDGFRERLQALGYAQDD